MKKRIASLDVHSPMYVRTQNGELAGGDIGDLYTLIDKASEAGFSILQFVPIQDTGKSACPYMGVSIFSYNPAYLWVKNPKEFIGNSILEKKIWQKISSTGLPRAPYRELYKFKELAIRKLFIRGNEFNKIQFSDFSQDEIAYAIFKVLKNEFRTVWSKWPKKFRDSNVARIIQENPKYHRKIKEVLFGQKLLKTQWNKLEDYAREKGISLALDKPIYPVYDSADVWANQRLFYLNKDKRLEYVSGCNNPGDLFGPQIWGHAVYKFEEKPKEVVEFLLRSIEHIAEICKIIRLDHTLALIWKYYIVYPESGYGIHKTALKAKFFKPLIEKFPKVLFIAEDVGFVDNKRIDKPLGKFNIPGLRCPQWDDRTKYTKLNNYPELCVAVTSNHDTNSMARWWIKAKKSRKRTFFEQMGDESKTWNLNQIVWRLIELLFSSNAFIASTTLRDLAGDLRRYNKPGVTDSLNWRNLMEIPVEEIDFTKINEIIKNTKRAN